MFEGEGYRETVCDGFDEGNLVITPGLTEASILGACDIGDAHSLQLRHSSLVHIGVAIW